MFTVGEFSQLAQVSKRLLRYYDEIGLLKPIRTDQSTGHRYYSVEQLPRLNRILALKDLGLSLEQIQRMLSANVSTDEIHGMLLLKKAEIEQQVQGELQRIRNIETRLQFIRSTEAGKPLDVVVKQIPVQPVLSVRIVLESLEAGLGIFGQIMTALPEMSAYGLFFVILHSNGFDLSNLDVEMGRILKAKTHAAVLLPGNLQLSVGELPAVAMMATYVVNGATESMLTGFSAIGTWAEVNGYCLAGAPREIVLQMAQSGDIGDGITEMQFPVEPIRQP